MKISLSALMPVCNAQSTLAPLVSQLLDVLSELTHRFEVLVIDNGSTDATAEVMADLAVLYPQVNRLVLPVRQERADVQRAALQNSSGEVVLYRGENCRTGFGGLGELWQAVHVGDIALIRSRPFGSLGSIPPLPNDQSAEESDWQMVRRQVLDGWVRTQSGRDWAGFLAARGFAVQEIDPCLVGSRPSRLAAVKLPPAPEQRTDAAASHGNRPTRRPNYLDRIKAFALGE
ncbi:MAG TPA: glycosyltransferase [Pirellulales bacterium]|nr:glycosyltransferase [Pirellulales bacterium]